MLSTSARKFRDPFLRASCGSPLPTGERGGEGAGRARGAEEETASDFRNGLLGFAAFVLLVLVASVGPGHAQQTYNSGSTGANGAFPPFTVPSGTATLSVDLKTGLVTGLTSAGAVTASAFLPGLPTSGEAFPNGVLNFTTVTVPAGVVLKFVPNANNTPVSILATGDVAISGTINLDGSPGQAVGSVLTSPTAQGGAGGPGGFRGGNGGLGAGNSCGGSAGMAGQGPGGGTAGVGTGGSGGSGSATASPTSLVPLIGGSGGGGSGGQDTNGGAGGGGGGAILIASSTSITINTGGSITALGGSGSSSSGGGFCFGSSVSGGPGGGGAIRLVAPTISGGGSILATSTGNNGKTRVEAFTRNLTGTITPTPSITTQPGTAIRANQPTLTLTSIAGIPVVNPTASVSTADIPIPSGTTMPVDVIVTATNTPTTATFTVRVAPQFGNATTATTTLVSGTQASSTHKASVTLPSGIAIVSAFGTFTVP